MWDMLGTEEHCLAIAELEAEVFPDNCFNETTLRNELRSGALGIIVPNYYFTPIGPDNKPRGYLIFKEKDGIIDIVRIGVHPDHRRLGIADKMMYSPALYKHDCMLCVAKYNEPALQLYLKHGFRIEACIGYHNDPKSHWVMVRRLET